MDEGARRADGLGTFKCNAVEAGYERQREFALCDELFSTGLNVTHLSGGMRRLSARVRGPITEYNCLVEPECKVF